MHILLTDILSCPRCGPEFGLILLADRIENRRVLEGVLGCANCRERYPIRGGFGDLRPAPDAAPPAPQAPEPGGRDEAFRLTALMGVAEGPGFLLVAGPAARLAPGIASIIDRGIEVVALDAALEGWSEEAGVSRLAAAGRLPFHDRSMRAVALSGEAAAHWVDEAARVVAPLGRVVVQDAGPDAAERLEALGLQPLAQEAGTIVAVRR